MARRFRKSRPVTEQTEAGEPKQRYTPEQVAIWKAMRMLSADELLARMPDHLKEFTKKVGSWLWIEMDFKPAPDVIEEIKSFGFSWSAKRSAWQNPCGETNFRHRKPAPYDPREKYGVQEVMS